MPLELGTYISDLIPTNPASADNMVDGDDHLRLIKNTIKNTFPNVTGPVTATQAELNDVVGATSALQTQVTAAQTLANTANTTANAITSAALLKAGGTMSGPIAMGGNKTTGLANGTAATDAAAFGQVSTKAELGITNNYTASNNNAKGAAVASNTSIDIWTAGDGNLIHVTGSGNILGFTNAPQAGTDRWLIADGTFTIGGVAIKIQGGNPYTATIGDVFHVIADTISTFYVEVFPINGSPSKWTEIIRGIDWQISSNTALVSDAYLQFPVVAGGTYEVSADVHIFSGPGGYKAAFVTGGTGTTNIHAVGADTATTNHTFTSTAGASQFVASAGSTGHQKIWVYFIASGTSNAGLQFAQNSSNVTATIFSAMSSIKYRRIS